MVSKTQTHYVAKNDPKMNLAIAEIKVTFNIPDKVKHFFSMRLELFACGSVYSLVVL